MLRRECAADYIEAKLRAAENDLNAFAHQQIIEALQISPEGVRSGHFRGVMNNGVNLAQPKQVAAAMRESNAVMYHQPSGEYRLTGQVFRTAIRKRKNKISEV